MFSTAQQPLEGQGLLIIEASRSHSVGLLWTSDQPATETSTWQHTTITRDKHACPRWDLTLQSQQASGRRTKPWAARPLGSVGCLHTLYNFASQI
jgi:hypothetical protein